MFVNFVCLVTLMLNFRRCCYGNQKFKKQINSFTKCDALGMGSSTNAIKRPIGIAAKLAKIAISAKIIHLGLQIGKTVLVTGDMHIFPVNWEMPKLEKTMVFLEKLGFISKVVGNGLTEKWDLQVINPLWEKLWIRQKMC